jgi:hypothetical protein
MPKLAHFSTPAGLPDAHPNEWSDRVGGLFAPYVDGHLPQFYDPRKLNTPPGAPEPMVSWVAFPATLRAKVHTADRWKIADGDRSLQDEYCEWTVTRKAGKVTRVTFTSEVPEYFEHLHATDPKRLVELYRELVDTRVKPADLSGAAGMYKRENKWNTSSPGRLAHLMQRNNNLAAAIDLVANATVPREKKNGDPVVNQQELVRCAKLGEPRRNSDPQIAQAVNNAARSGARITLANPPGLHLGKPLTAGLVTPDGTDAAEFWTIERGDAKHTLRARFEVPARKNYVVGDIKVDGRPIQFGGQIADRVQVWVKVVVKAGKHAEPARPCEK